MNLIKLQSQIRKQSKTYGRNLVLENAEKQKEFTNFQNKLRIALSKQMNEVIDSKMVADLMILKVEEVNQNQMMFLSTKWKKITDYLKEGLLSSFYLSGANIGGQAALDGMEIVAKPFELTNPELIGYYKTRGELLVQSIDNTTKKELLGILRRGEREMLSNTEIASMIRKQIPEIAEYRAELIARNEMSMAINSMQYETFRRNGVEKVRWVTAMDDRTCPHCEQLHNTVIQMTERFISSVANENGDKTTTYNVIRPPLHVGCRCYLEEVIEGFDIVNNQVKWMGN